MLKPKEVVLHFDYRYPMVKGEEKVVEEDEELVRYEGDDVCETL